MGTVSYTIAKIDKNGMCTCPNCGSAQLKITHAFNCLNPNISADKVILFSRTTCAKCNTFIAVEIAIDGKKNYSVLDDSDLWEQIDKAHDEEWFKKFCGNDK